jgi:hypothetical protein
VPKEPLASLFIELVEKSTLMLKYRERMGKSPRIIMSRFFTICKRSDPMTFFSSKGTPTHALNPFKSQALFSPREASPSREFPQPFRCVFLLAILSSCSQIRFSSWVSSASRSFLTLSIYSSRRSIGEEVHFSGYKPCGREFLPISLGRMPVVAKRV